MYSRCPAKTRRFRRPIRPTGANRVETRILLRAQGDAVLARLHVDVDRAVDSIRVVNRGLIVSFKQVDLNVAGNAANGLRCAVENHHVFPGGAIAGARDRQHVFCEPPPTRSRPPTTFTPGSMTWPAISLASTSNVASTRLRAAGQAKQEQQREQARTGVEQVGDVVQQVAQDLAVAGLGRQLASMSLVVTTRPSRSSAPACRPATERQVEDSRRCPARRDQSHGDSVCSGRRERVQQVRPAADRGAFSTPTTFASRALSSRSAASGSPAWRRSC